MNVFQECASLTEWQEIQVPSASDKGVYYLVTLPPWDREEQEAVCECPSYEFRGKCRHQREALSYVCSWTSLDGSEQVKQGTCPDCGGPTKTVIVND